MKKEIPREYTKILLSPIYNDRDYKKFNLRLRELKEIEQVVRSQLNKWQKNKIYLTNDYIEDFFNIKSSFSEKDFQDINKCIQVITIDIFNKKFLLNKLSDIMFILDQTIDLESLQPFEDHKLQQSFMAELALMLEDLLNIKVSYEDINDKLNISDLCKYIVYKLRRIGYEEYTYSREWRH